METQILAKKVKEIKMPDEMQERILRRCYEKANLEKENIIMKKTNAFFKKPVAVAASLVLCLCITGVTALAATGNLKGFFRDITDWRGAITGTAYEQATDELEVKVAEVADDLILSVTMVNPNVAPYIALQELGVEKYQILDASGKVVMEGETTAMAQITDGQASIVLPVSEIGGGTYKLVISAFVGGAKAEQPLTISGTWECDFSR